MVANHKCQIYTDYCSQLLWILIYEEFFFPLLILRHILIKFSTCLQSVATSQPVNQAALLNAIRQFQTSTVRNDIDQAAKYIGAGAATVGVAGSGKLYFMFRQLIRNLSVNSKAECHYND